MRVYAEQVYGIPPEQVIGTAGGTKYGYGKDGKPFLTKEPKLLLNDNNAGKPEGIHLMIGRRPVCGVRQLDRRPADARIHQGAATARGCACWCCTTMRRANTPTARPQGLPDTQGRHVHPGALRRGEEAGLGRDQHEERLEAHLRLRAMKCSNADCQKSFAAQGGTR